MIEKFPGKPQGPRNSSIELSEYLAGKAEFGIDSALMHSLSQFAGKLKEWKEQDPKSLIDEMIARLPSKPEIMTREAAMSDEAFFKKSLTLEYSDEYGAPTELEAYMLTKTLLHDPKSIQFSGTEYVERSFDKFTPAESIRCMRDVVRTKKFMTAVRSAVETAAERKRVVEVCDAGSGAIPILGLYAALSSPSARVTCLENNPHAVQLARAAVEAFGLSDRVRVERQDATKYYPQHKIDVLVSETMDTGLIEEPLCAILNHLQRFTGEGAAIIPSKVETLAAAVPVRQLTDANEFVHLVGKYYPHIDASWVQTGEFTPGKNLKEIQAKLPAPTTNEQVAVMVASKVYLGADSLDLYDSIISMPQSVMQQNWDQLQRKVLVPRRGQSIQIIYAPGSRMEDILLRTI